MRTEEPRIIRLEDYRPSEYLIDTVDLTITLDPLATRVVSEIKVRANPDVPAHGDLVLKGDEVRLISVAMDGKPLAASAYTASDMELVIKSPPKAFALKIETEIAPGKNTKLQGLYFANGLYCTQCEPEGFRRMVYHIDRPDVLSVFSTRIIADKAAMPVLLSNGNEVERGELPGGRHYVLWRDPFPKPAYLFALAAGRLGVIEDKFVTRSGRTVRLRIFVDPGNEEKVTFAMGAVRRSMRWDEDKFGLEYDLDDFMIVAVHAFNQGAMENKGLNIFNAALLLATPDIATDADYERIEGVIAHEYFHNWTGDRVTCRDWFQLSLKEGLTVFRDQLFTADMRDAAVKRIDDVKMLRARQFKEDDGPLAHPPRPGSFIEIENFYTATVYEKGAEICRMLATVLGTNGFRKGMDLYFKRHDGTAARVEDFVAAMGDANGRDLSPYMRWYAQAGRPRVTAETHYDERTRSFELRLKQETAPTPGEAKKLPQAIPLAIGLLDEAGNDIALRLDGEPAHAAKPTRVIEFKDAEARYTFVDVPRPAARSLLREFSAPVTLDLKTSAEEDAFLMAYDSDPFNRWDAGQRYATRLLLEGAAAWRGGKPMPEDPRFIEAMERTLSNQSLEPAFKALALTLPSVGDLAQAASGPVDYEALFEARHALRQRIGRALETGFRRQFEAPVSDSIDAPNAGPRALRNTALAYLVAGSGKHTPLAFAHYTNAKTMTDRMAALALLADTDSPERERALADFYERFKGDTLLVDKWLGVQGRACRKQTLAEVKRLAAEPIYDRKNPNRVRALLGAYAHGNFYRFFTDGAEGFKFLADEVIKLDAINPMVAARMLSALESWRRLPAGLQAAAKAGLERVKATPGLSRNTFEIAAKSLGSG